MEKTIQSPVTDRKIFKTSDEISITIPIYIWIISKKENNIKYRFGLKKAKGAHYEIHHDGNDFFQPFTIRFQ